MKKEDLMRLTALGAALILTISLVVGCGSSQPEQPEESPKKTTPPADAPDEELDVDTAPALDLLPGDGEVAGWALVEPGRLYAGDELYDPINGAADKYFQFNFVEGAFATYEHGAGTVNVQVYTMGSPDDAAGIYSTYDDPNAEHTTLGDTGVGLVSDTSLDFAKGPYFVRLLSQGAAVNRDELFAFSSVLTKAIDEPFHTPSVLGLLPEGYVRGTVKYFRTAATLDDVFYMGGDNVLGLSEQTFGVSACYGTKTSAASTKVGTDALFVITHAANEDAGRAFASAIKHYGDAPYNIYGVPEGPGAQLTIAENDVDLLRIARHGTRLYGVWMIEDTESVNDLMTQLGQRITRKPAGGEGP